MKIRHLSLLFLMVTMHVPTAFSMYCLARRFPSTSYSAIPFNRMPLTQKRAFGSSDTEDLFLVLGLCSIPVIYAAGLIGAGYGAYKYGTFLYQKSQANRYKNDAYAYVNICSVNNTPLLNEQLLKELDTKEKGRLQFLLEMNKHYEQLCFVESAESDNYFIQKNSSVDQEKYQKIFTAIASQKKNIYEAVCMIQEDMPNYQTKRENFYAQQLGIQSVPPTIKEKIELQIKEQPFDHLITSIITKHLDTNSEQKKLMAKE